MAGTRHIVGLAIDDCGVVATELCLRAGGTEIHRSGEFSWNKELTGETAVELGQQLRQFLHERGFTAKIAAVGLAAKWVLAREVETPPAAPEALAGILGIQAERVFSMSASELVFDYCGKASTSEKSQVLLLAAKRQLVDQVKTLTAAAGLHVQSITVSAFACGSAPSDNGSACRYGLYTRPTYCEFWGQSPSGPQFIKHIPLVVDGNPAGYADLLTAAVQRHVLLSSRQDQAPPHHVAAYDACGLSVDVFKRLNERLGPQITVRNGRFGLLSRAPAASQGSQDDRTVAAAAVAMTAVGPDKPVVDFLNPRIGEKKKASNKRVLVWGAVAAGVCLIGLFVWLAGWRSDVRHIAEYKAQLEAMSEDIATAQSVVDRLSYADKWGDTTPRFLSCLRELTQAFPDEGYVWASSMALTENGSGSVVGKASSENSVFDVLDKINKNEAFSNVKMIHIRDVGQNSSEKDFAVSFVFKGAK